MSGATLTYPGSGYEAALDLGSAEIGGGVFLDRGFLCGSIRAATSAWADRSSCATPPSPLPAAATTTPRST